MTKSSSSPSPSPLSSISSLFVFVVLYLLVTIVIASSSTSIGEVENVGVGIFRSLRDVSGNNNDVKQHKSPAPATAPAGGTSVPPPKPKPKSKSSSSTSHPQPQPQDLLSFTHYQKSCPGVEGIIERKVAAWVKKDHTFAASLIRLHFHDCAVRGCDASILLNHPGSERRAKASKTLRGFEVIDDIKAEVERKCPKTVSCADILTAAARDATVDVGGPFWAVPFGRKDGRISIAKEADTVPMGHETVTDLLHFCQARGLNVLDLVVLSGAHTIGRSTCGPVQERLYKFNGTGRPDPSLDSKYLNDLRRKCRTSTEFVDLDTTTPTKFDTIYYTNLQKKKGLLTTDQLLNSDPRTAPFVTAFATQPTIFDPQFAASMVKLGNIQVLRGDNNNNQGEIRLNCNFVNHPHHHHR